MRASIGPVILAGGRARWGKRYVDGRRPWTRQGFGVLLGWRRRPGQPHLALLWIMIPTTRRNHHG